MDDGDGAPRARHRPPLGHRDRRALPRSTSPSSTSGPRRIVGARGPRPLGAPDARASSPGRSSSSPRRPASSSPSALGPPRGVRQLAEWRRRGPRARPKMSVNLSARQLGDAPARRGPRRRRSATHGSRPTPRARGDRERPHRETEFPTPACGPSASSASASPSTTSAPATPRSATCTLPVDRLKIDRAFVQAMATAAAPRAGASRSSGPSSTSPAASRWTWSPRASRTETEWHLLQSLGCGLGQGFYFSRPVPPVEIGPKLEAIEVSGHGEGRRAQGRGAEGGQAEGHRKGLTVLERIWRQTRRQRSTHVPALGRGIPC